MTLEEILDNFELLDDWEDRYRYIIELGRTLEDFPEARRVDAHKVHGCASQVWLVTDTISGTDGDEPVLHFRGDSDAHIVSGLIAILLAIYSGQPPSTILATDPGAIFDKLGLSGHLTQQRSNGLASMVARIRREAESAQKAAS